MRLELAAGFLLSQLSLGMIWLLQPVQKDTFDRLIPSDILGLIVVSNPPTSLDSLNHTRLQRWLDVRGESLRERIPGRLREEVGSWFQNDLKSAWFLIHGVKRRPDGPWRIDFTSFLVPRPRHQEAIRLRIELAVRNIFGINQTKIFERDNIRIYTGSRPAQILYQVQMPDFILISNSEEGWQKTLRTTLGKEPNLAESTSFRRVKSHLQINAGLFVYLRANRLFRLLPEFGYLIRWKEGLASDDYYEVKIADN